MRNTFFIANNHHLTMGKALSGFKKCFPGPPGGRNRRRTPVTPICNTQDVHHETTHPFARAGRSRRDRFDVLLVQRNGNTRLFNTDPAAA
jgi:hypothetical protein